MISRSNSRLFILFTITSVIAFIAILLYQPTPKLTLPISAPTADVEKIIPSPVTFHDVSLEWQLNASHQQTSKHLSALTETLGSGICAIDVNKDGWMDLFLVGGSGHTRHYGKKSWWHKVKGNRLLLNKQGHHFEDVTEQSGLQVPVWGMACAVADFDNNGFADLMVTGVGKNLIFKNNGDLSFSDMTEKSGIVSDRWSTAASLADFNDDGLIDIYVSNYILFTKGARTFERTSGFRTTSNIAFDQTLYDPEPNRLYLNKGNFQFDEIAETMGVANSLGRSLGAKWVDINNDTWPDLLVINDHNTPNQLFINNQGKNFSRGGDNYAAFEIAGAHDVVIDHFNNEPSQEFFISRGMGHPPVLLTPASINYSSQQTPLFPNQQSYTDEAWSRGVAQTRLLAFSGWAAAPGDFNNDSFVDLYVANGNTLPDIDSHFVSQAQSNSLFINDGNNAFISQAASSDSLHPYSSRGVISVDLDNDGQLEIVVSNNNDTLQVFKNQPPITNKITNNWIGLDLQQSFKDTDIYGAQLTIETDKQTIHRTLQAPQAFLSQGDGRVHIGLAEAKQVNELVIKWRNGSQSIFNNINTNQYYSVDKASNTLKAQHYQVASNSHFDQSLASYSDKALMHLAELLITTSFDGKNNDDILLIWQQASASVRQSILERIAQQWGIKRRPDTVTVYLLLIKQALADKDANVRRLAVEQLKRAELETSVVWLIPRLFDEDVNVQCATAEAFRFFFDEEEAVTHRKKLAISPLIRLLESGSPQAIICAANALAAAENKRAILPLIKLVKQHQDLDVKVTAIRALGLIRDTKALALLQELVKNQSSPAPIVASSLIALSRLNDPALDALFEQYFALSFSLSEKASAKVAEQARLYDTLNVLFSTPDGIVFAKTKLLNTLLNNLEAHKPLAQKSVQLAALKAMAATKSPRIETTLRNFLNTSLQASDQTIRAQALMTLASVNSSSSRHQFERQLSKETPTLIKTVLDQLIDFNHVFSRSSISSLFLRTDTSALALDLLQRLPNQRASALFDSLLKNVSNKIDLKMQDETQLLALLTTCTEADLHPTISDLSPLSKASPTLRLRAIDCFLQWQPDSQTNTNKQTQVRSASIKRNLITHKILKAVSNDSQLDSDTKTRLLIKAAAHNNVIARTTLAKRIDSLPEKWLGSALTAFETAGVTAVIEDKLWKLYRNKHHTMEVRLQAAVLLASIDDKTQNNTGKETNNKDQVMSYLFEQFANNQHGNQQDPQ